MIRRPPRSTLFPYTTLFRSTDPNFARSVILIAEHTEEGAMGLVLNRPAETTVAEAVPDLTWLVPGIANVFVGGPVAETAVIVLAEFDRPELAGALDRKSTRLNSSHANISYAVFCL